ncbi:SOS response-associated peptidase [Bacillus aquiflavi]|uniref:Abasic site processing protein n=1 Tax=Bacillus aquiflavi TaxID=2672567 RepID=A0A6B3W0L3_9BACI|nr:SOS response-associated peptidase [Bacillus aquiflavi]MBA4537246.1 SOS response-associated peptidase [Bacillus aquiflavi]NEY81503.1 SOS response-associated peptidase [Bacillus aquiflavi]UAC49489.1 SOS response-associated peptidase [Bacillus aquiflavi]
MCGRFTLFTNYDEIIKRFNVKVAFNENEYKVSYNIAPSHHVVSVINDGDKNRLGYLRWGLIPPWAKDEKIGYNMINARAETLAEKPSFSNAFKKKRCLIIADSFYEWRKTREQKIPVRIKLKTDELFAMAGLWEGWRTQNNDVIYSCTIITTEANEFMSSIHERMPVILKREDEKRWLDPSINNINDLKELLKPFDSHLMDYYEVSPEVNSPKNNAPHLIKQV